jgi:hypothetical protein
MAPKIISQPDPCTVTSKKELKLKVQVSGRPPLSFRWHFQGQPLIAPSELDPMSSLDIGHAANMRAPVVGGTTNSSSSPSTKHGSTRRRRHSMFDRSRGHGDEPILLIQNATQRHEGDTSLPLLLNLTPALNVCQLQLLFF